MKLATIGLLLLLSWGCASTGARPPASEAPATRALLRLIVPVQPTPEDLLLARDSGEYLRQEAASGVGTVDAAGSCGCVDAGGSGPSPGSSGSLVPDLEDPRPARLKVKVLLPQ